MGSKMTPFDGPSNFLRNEKKTTSVSHLDHEINAKAFFQIMTSQVKRKFGFWDNSRNWRLDRRVYFFLNFVVNFPGYPLVRQSTQNVSNSAILSSCDVVFEITKELEELRRSTFFHFIANLSGYQHNFSTLRHFVSNSAILDWFDLDFEITRELEMMDLLLKKEFCSKSFWLPTQFFHPSPFCFKFRHFVYVWPCLWDN